MKEKIGLYIHIPFCKQKCIYCAFTSFCNENKNIEPYFNKLKQELNFHKKEIKNKVISSIFIGGGTPSFVDSKYICDLLCFVRANFNVQKNAEISIEGNPDSINTQKAIAWKKAGINRVSVGLQSIDDKTLQKLNRPHTKKDFVTAIKCLKEVGFTNINADILIGLFNQTPESIKETIKFLSDQNLTHISSYGIMVEEETPLDKLVKNKEIILPDEDKAVSLYNIAVNELKKHGYNRYEISNFCKSGFECKHNLNYWHRGEFLGVGLSAYSFLNKTHFENTKSLKEYLEKTYEKKNIERETSTTAKEEFIMLSLRLEEGLDIKKYNTLFHEDFLKRFEKQINKLKQSKLITFENNKMKITNFEVSNMIISEFF